MRFNATVEKVFPKLLAIRYSVRAYVGGYARFDIVKINLGGRSLTTGGRHLTTVIGCFVIGCFVIWVFCDLDVL